MKNLIFASIVGAVIMFVWGAISWMALSIHTQSFKYTPAQDSIMKTLQKANLSDGAYMIPMADNRNVESSDSKYKEESMRLHEEMTGSPAATIFYKSSMSETPSYYILGFLYMFISVFFASVILVTVASKVTTFSGRWWIVMLIASIIALEGPMAGMNWYGEPWHLVRGMLVDVFVSWGLCGLWLSWYFGKKLS